MVCTLRRTFPIPVSLFALLLAQVANADNLQSFKDAEREKGCASLPYSSLRGNCKSKQEGVEQWCKHEKRQCRDLGTRGLLDAIDGMTRKVESLKSDKDSLSSKKAHAKDDSEKRDLENKITDVEKQIYELNGRMDAHKRQVDENKTNIRDRIYRGERCRDHRRDVQEVFKDATSRAKSESDPEIKPLAQKLLDRWDESTRSHEGEIDTVKQIIEDCRECLDGRR